MVPSSSFSMTTTTNRSPRHRFERINQKCEKREREREREDMNVYVYHSFSLSLSWKMSEPERDRNVCSCLYNFITCLPSLFQMTSRTIRKTKKTPPERGRKDKRPLIWRRKEESCRNEEFAVWVVVVTKTKVAGRCSGGRLWLFEL